MSDARCMNVKRASEYSGFPREFLRRATRAGEIDYIRNGERGMLYFLREDLDRFIEERRHARKGDADRPRVIQDPDTELMAAVGQPRFS